MMKKLTKAALLAAATAFLLAGMTACFTSASDVDDDTTQTGSNTGSGGNTSSDDATTASFLMPDTVSSEEIAAGGTVKDTDLFTITTEGKLAYSIGKDADVGVGRPDKAVTFTLLDGTSKTFTQGLKQGDATDPDGTTETKKISIKAKEAVTLRAYVTLANDSYNSDRAGKIYYAVDSKEVKSVAVSKRTDATVIEASLAKDETLAIYAIIDKDDTKDDNGALKNTAKLWFFGAEAEKQ